MSAADHWSAQLGEWRIPDEILAQAPISPWTHDVATFSVDDTLDRDGLSASVAREVLPVHGGVVLDVGCGGGRSSAVLVPPAETLIGFDANPSMLSAFEVAARTLGVVALQIHGRWPDVASVAPVADVVVCHHVFFNVAEAVPFATALTEHARLAVVVEIPLQHKLSGWNAAFKHFWDLDRPVRARPMPIWSASWPRQDSSRRSGTAIGHRCRGIPAIRRRCSPRQRRRLCLHPDRDAEPGRLSRRQSDRLRRDRGHAAVARHGGAAGVKRRRHDRPLGGNTPVSRRYRTADRPRHRVRGR